MNTLNVVGSPLPCSACSILSGGATVMIESDPRGTCNHCNGPLGQDNVDRTCGQCAAEHWGIGPLAPRECEVRTSPEGITVRLFADGQLVENMDASDVDHAGRIMKAWIGEGEILCEIPGFTQEVR